MGYDKIDFLLNQIPCPQTRSALAHAVKAMMAEGADDGSISPAKLAGVADNIGAPFVLTAAFADGATGDVAVYSSNAPFKFRIIDAWVENDAANGSNANTIRVCAAAAGADGITDAMSLEDKAAKAIVRAGEIDKAKAEVDAGGSLFLRRTRAGGTMGGLVRILAVKI